MLYKNIKAMVHSLDDDIGSFNIVAGVLKGNTLAKYVFIISLNYVLQTSIDLIKENVFII